MSEKPYLIICTKDRPDDMKRLLTSVRTQSLRPEKIINDDGLDKLIKNILPEFEDLNLEYTDVRPPSLPKQRNVGISMLPDHANWVGFLDDDLELKENSLEMVMKAGKKTDFKKELVGIAMIINDVPYPKFNIFRGLFFLDAPKGGSFTYSGSPTMYRDIDSTVEVEWLSGGVTFWKKKALDEFKFDEWFSGTGYMEDIDFSYRVSRKYSLASCGEARCYHYHHPIPVEKIKTLGTWQVTSWWYFATKMNFAKVAILWSLVGLAFNNFILGLLSPSSNRLRKFAGNITGINKVLCGKALVKSNWVK